SSVAHATSGGRGGPGNKAGDGFFAIFLNPFGGFLLRSSADFADHNDAVCVRISVEHFDHVQVGRAVHGIASNTDTGRLADTTRSQLPNRLIRERAAAGDDADVSFLMNVAGSDANAAAAERILPFARRYNARAIRA